MWILVQLGIVAKAGPDAKGLIGQSLEEVKKLVSQNGDQIYPVASSWHTCVDWPHEICGACQQGNLGPHDPRRYEIKPENRLSHLA